MRRLVAAAAVLALLAAGGVSLASSSSADTAPAFSASFDTPADFYGRFDMGYSGYVPGENGASSTVTHYHGDHDLSCGGPTTDRDVALSGPASNFDFSQVFWYCAPGGDGTKGHVMTGVDTTGYNIAWFSPKPFFSNVTKVCWDINETMMSRRKWTTVMFVGQADATRYPVGVTTQVESIARGTGGFDLGYTSPDFRVGVGPTTGIEPLSGTLAGLRLQDGGERWFQNQDTFTSDFVGPGAWDLPAPDREQTTDKAARFTHCLSNGPNNTVVLTKATPTTGTVIRTLPGQIPQGPVRVVFEDDNYDPRKDDRYQANVLTWHWDNIQVFTDDGSGAPATTAPPSTTASSPTTTVASTTTIAPTTTSTTTTVPDPCVAFTDPGQHAWCVKTESRLAALGG